MLFHQPVNFLMIDDPSFLLQFTGHIPVAIAAELLRKGLFNLFYNNCIFYQLTILVHAMRTGPDSLVCPGTLVVKTAWL